MSPLPVDLGLIEGYYGRPWSWEARVRVVDRIATAGYRFHLYAPKAATFLRRAWRAPLTASDLDPIAAHAAHCRSRGLRFGVGLSPVGIEGAFDRSDTALLIARIKTLRQAMGLDELALLFDDIRGDDPTLAVAQSDLVAAVLDATGGLPLVVCPTYYSDDPVLDRVFGMRPMGYLETLGRRLDASVRVFWTGEEVCSREHSARALGRVAEVLQRRPLLWDNYPVNDGARMSQVLHLRAFTGRPAALAPLLAGHAVNPALQPELGCIPLLTLAARYREGDAAWAYGEALEAACLEVTQDAALSAALRSDLVRLQDTGLDRLGAMTTELRERYAAFDGPAAREVVAWLDGAYRITDDEVQTQ